ncbi:DUF3558 domain-containing protein [Mycobacteroides abscessus]|uniref:DUF3558 domain-containing protein n=1 Tax=Mycobacteroides abscessus TaxID=36809 RepID=UPI0021077090|nr:DUF3558 domain-containing protein [Mycobacteroides abscessus]
MSRLAFLASLVLVAAACSSPVTGAPTTSQLPTNSKGRVHITFDPCKEIPASVVGQLHLDRKPPRPDTQTDGEIETVFCKYYPQTRYLLTVSASNYTLDMLKKANNHWGYQDLEVGGRRALFAYRGTAPAKDSCIINVEATTGVYGVAVDTSHEDFTPYPDCMTAARTNTDALLSYFPL